MRTKSNISDISGLPTEFAASFLEKTETVADQICKVISGISGSREDLRKILHDKNFIKKAEDSENNINFVDSCAVGSFHALENYPGRTLAYTAAFVSEGLSLTTDVSENKYSSFTSVLHLDKTTPQLLQIVKGLRSQLEIEKITTLPHQLVLKKGSIVNSFINMMEAFKPAIESPDSNLTKEFVQRLKPSITGFKSLSGLSGNGKIFAGIPFFNISGEISKALNVKNFNDDISLLTLLLSEGEYTLPVKCDFPELSKVKNINIKDESFMNVIESINNYLSDINFFYYKPFPWTKAFRIETDKSVISNPVLFNKLLETLKLQCRAAGISEPYPLYKVIKISESLEASLSVIRENAISKIKFINSSDAGELFNLLNENTALKGDCNE